MPTLVDFGGFRITMNPGDHSPPHVHVVGPDFEALLRIADGGIEVGGPLPKRVLTKARAYILAHRAQLTAEWDRLNRPRRS